MKSRIAQPNAAEQVAEEPSPAAPPAKDEQPGTNAVEHEPDPAAQPLPDGHHKYVPRSPYTTGNE